MPSFDALTTATEVLADVDLTGTVAVVTGASSGLGHGLVQILRDHGATVVATARRPPAEGVSMDLASLASVRAGAASILATHPHIDLLFNNAGIMATAEQRTVDGFEMQLATNHLGHFLLTSLLRPAFGTATRVVNTSSLGHHISGIRWDDPHFTETPYEKWTAYGQSKSANVLFAIGLAARGVQAHAVHPGAIDTSLTAHLEGAELEFVKEASANELKTVEQGIATLVWAATAPNLRPGSYIADCTETEPAPHAADPAEAERLWAWSAAQTCSPGTTTAAP